MVLLLMVDALLKLPDRFLKLKSHDLVEDLESNEK